MEFMGDKKMQVIKRDGNIVDFDQSKIEIAIGKANKEVKPSLRASKEDIKEIVNYINELDKIILAQKSRGSEISSGGLINRVKAFIPLLVPLFISAFQRAEDLAIAMEVRGYETHKKRTSYRKLYWRWADSLLLMLIVPIAIILFILKHIGV